MRKLIFISSCEYSGSTLLDTLLSTHKNIVGLGEVAAIIDNEKYKDIDFESHLCTCGDTLNKCRFWGRFFESVNMTGDNVQQLFKMADDYFEEDIILSDSSKYTNPLLKRINCESINKIYVIHLIKDVRTYTASVEKRGKQNVLRTFKIMSNWRKRNQEITELIRKKDLQHLNVNYEELCLNTSKVLQEISKFLGIQDSFYHNGLSDGESHIITGNSMRTDEKKLAGIKYDKSWFYNDKINLVYLLNYKAKKYNELISNEEKIH